MTRILSWLVALGFPALGLCLLIVQGLGPLGVLLAAGGAALALAGVWIAGELGRTADEVTRHGE